MLTLFVGFQIAAEPEAYAAAYAVTTVADSGPGSLRQAILDANANPGWDLIKFGIPAAGVQTIKPLTPLPAVVDKVTIDGSTQGWPDHRVALDGSALRQGVYASGLVIVAGGSVLHHLVVHSFEGYGLELAGLQIVVSDCRIGTDASGLVERGNDSGVYVSGTGHWIVSNQVSGNRWTGLVLDGGTSHLIEHNLIGPDRNGLAFCAGSSITQLHGIAIASDGSVIRDNVIAVAYAGVWLGGGSENVITANLIGVATDGKTLLGTQKYGIIVLGPSERNRIGDVNEPNRIANVGWGNWSGYPAGPSYAIWVGDIGSGTPLDNTIRGNLIHDLHPSATLAIDLGGPGQDVNDPLDTDSGPNDLQNSPEALDAFTRGGVTSITGALWSAPHTPFTIDVYATNRTLPAGACEAHVHLGSVKVGTSSNGNVKFTLQVPALKRGVLVSATATVESVQGVLGSTSELSPCVVVQ